MAMGVHPGTQGMPRHFPDSQMHAGMHAEACTFSSGLMPYALNQAHAYASHFGRRKVECMRLLWARIQALIGCLGTRLHAGMHADLVALSPASLVSCTLCPVHSSRHYNFVEFWTVSSRYRQRERRMHAGVHSCTPKIAYTLACILYLAILRARIDSACIHVA